MRSRRKAASAKRNPRPGEAERFPFLFGAQYYRAPTPEPACWEGDLGRMRELGFNAVKFFVQWRWSHRAEDRFFFDDLDRLMDLAHANGLGVTLNVLMDMAPTWLYRACPDARQVDAQGHVVEPYAVAHRTIGGHPGPCYRHPGALVLRRRFLSAAAEHFRGHPALSMWDVWNEPELSFQQRHPDVRTMVCYCPRCHEGFIAWLRDKYGQLDRLNQVWGRCYADWEEVEMPRVTGAITDFVDWREFHLDTLTGEATWRLRVIEELDPCHGRYLHVVPVYFSAVTCVDDFAVAEPCEVFAASMGSAPSAIIQVISAGRGKICYNVESHVNHGCTNLHQPVVDDQALRRNFLAQVGLGVKGFLFWQYRPEVLGGESPAWGLVRLDGTDRPATLAARDFWAGVRPHAAGLLKARPAVPRVGIWKSRKNEIFHFCIQDSVASLNAAVEAYTNALYWRNTPFCYLPGSRLASGDLVGVPHPDTSGLGPRSPDELAMLVMPCGYYLTAEEATALDRWVRGGGVLLTEAHLAGYNASTGRHSRVLPGCGLAESWGLRESESTASCHLRLGQRQALATALPDDVRKALDASGATGGACYPIRLRDGRVVLGAHRYAELAGNLIDEGTHTGKAPCLASVAVGKGRVFYCGANFGQAAPVSDAGLQAVLDMALRAAGVEPLRNVSAELPGSIHLDMLTADTGQRYAVVLSNADRAQTITLEGQERWRGVFTDTVWELRGSTPCPTPAQFAELFVVE